MIKIIQNETEWNTTIKEANYSDFYHGYKYHFFSKKETETPILIKYYYDDGFIALPFFLKPILGTPYFDITSAYGYLGPISKDINEEFNNGEFLNELDSLLKKQKIVSVFSRLNPFIPKQEEYLNGLGEILTIGKIVNIDIVKPLYIQKSQYSKRLKTYINGAKKQCYIITATDMSDLKTFIQIYYDNMKRVHAKKDYFFSESYFISLFKDHFKNSKLLLTKLIENDKIIAGSFFLKTGNIIQYHLSASKSNYLHLSPIKLLIDEMRILATKENFSYFNLGGGLGNQNDSLFHFKSKFSKDFKDFKLWKYIVNPDIYYKLCEKHRENRLCTENPKNCKVFFPYYKCCSNF